MMEPNLTSSDSDQDYDSNHEAYIYSKSVDETLKSFLEVHLPENQRALKESQSNLDKIANYCDENYFDNINSSSDESLKTTKNYVQQALASIFDQISTYASNIQTTIDLLESQFDALEVKKRNLEMLYKLNNEKIQRRKIGMLAKPKSINVQPPIIYPEKQIKPYKFRYQPLDLNSLDNVGIGYKVYERSKKSKKSDNRKMPSTKSATLRPSKSSNLSSILPPNQAFGSISSNFSANSTFYSRTPTNVAQLTVRPPTPPTLTLGPGMFGSLARNPKGDYRSLIVPPPQVPSNSAFTKDVASDGQQQTFEPSNSKVDQQQVSMAMMGDPKQQSSSNQSPAVAKALEVTEANADWIPANYIEKVIAMYDYTADKDDELSFKENSIIYVIRKNEDGWYEGVLNGITGLFPGNYVEIYL